jgi:hypothetical protein
MQNFISPNKPLFQYLITPQYGWWDTRWGPATITPLNPPKPPVPIPTTPNPKPIPPKPPNPKNPPPMPDNTPVSIPIGSKPTKPKKKQPNPKMTPNNLSSTPYWYNNPFTQMQQNRSPYNFYGFQ